MFFRELMKPLGERQICDYEPEIVKVLLQAGAVKFGRFGEHEK